MFEQLFMNHNDLLKESDDFNSTAGRKKGQNSFSECFTQLAVQSAPFSENVWFLLPRKEGALGHVLQRNMKHVKINLNLGTVIFNGTLLLPLVSQRRLNSAPYVTFNTFCAVSRNRRFCDGLCASSGWYALCLTI